MRVRRPPGRARARLVARERRRPPRQPRTRVPRRGVLVPRLAVAGVGEPPRTNCSGALARSILIGRWKMRGDSMTCIFDARELARRRRRPRARERSFAEHGARARDGSKRRGEEALQNMFCLTSCAFCAHRVEPKNTSLVSRTDARGADRASPRVVPGDMSASASTLFTRAPRRSWRHAPPPRAAQSPSRARAPRSSSAARHPRPRAALSTTSSAVCAPAFASAGDRVADLALSDAWFDSYFAPGGVVLGPALIFTAFILGHRALREAHGGPRRKAAAKE